MWGTVTRQLSVNHNFWREGGAEEGFLQRIWPRDYSFDFTLETLCFDMSHYRTNVARQWNNLYRLESLCHCYVLFVCVFVCWFLTGNWASFTLASITGWEHLLEVCTFFLIFLVITIDVLLWTHNIVSGKFWPAYWTRDNESLQPAGIDSSLRIFTQLFHQTFFRSTLGLNFTVLARLKW